MKTIFQRLAAEMNVFYLTVALPSKQENRSNFLFHLIQYFSSNEWENCYFLFIFIFFSNAVRTVSQNSNNRLHYLWLLGTVRNTICISPDRVWWAKAITGVIFTRTVEVLHLSIFVELDTHLKNDGRSQETGLNHERLS